MHHFAALVGLSIERGAVIAITTVLGPSTVGANAIGDVRLVRPESIELPAFAFEARRSIH
jgi:hypothetical protein